MGVFEGEAKWGFASPKPCLTPNKIFNDVAQENR